VRCEHQLGKNFSQPRQQRLSIEVSLLGLNAPDTRIKHLDLATKGKEFVSSHWREARAKDQPTCGVTSRHTLDSWRMIILKFLIIIERDMECQPDGPAEHQG
jgi:hypothetical protein